MNLSSRGHRVLVAGLMGCGSAGETEGECERNRDAQAPGVSVTQTGDEKAEQECGGAGARGGYGHGWR